MLAWFIHISFAQQVLTQTEATRQIRTIFHAIPQQGMSAEQHGRLVNILTQWHDGLDVLTLSPETTTYEQLVHATQGWLAWQHMVSVLGLQGDFPQATDVTHENIEAVILPLAVRLYKKCKQHDISQLTYLMHLSQWVTWLGFGGIDTGDIHDMISRCGQFKLLFTSNLSWGGANQFKMTTAADVPFKIKFEKQEYMGKAPLRYITFKIVNTEQHECNLRPFSTKNGVLDVKDFSIDNQHWSLVILPQDIWETWGLEASCDIQRTTHSTDWLALWHTMHASERTALSAEKLGYVITDWQHRLLGNIIATKRYKRSLHKHGMILYEDTLLKIMHTPQ